jgi:4a-hydroxytetrahydrobiopterin dehydratase
MPKDQSHQRAGGKDDLAKRRCIPCEEGGKPLGAEEIAALLWQLEGWEAVKRHHLTKEWTFDDFAQALAFVNKVGALAEKEGHHPDLFLKWGLVRAEIYTHSVDGLTESDFVLAAKIDKLPAR